MTITDTTFRVISDKHSNHNLPIGATVSYLRYDTFNEVVLYTQGGDGDAVAIDARDLEPLINLKVLVTNYYEDGDKIRLEKETSVPFPPAGDAPEYDDWEQDNIYCLTGTGREHGDSAYVVEVKESSHPRLIAVGAEYEFGF